MEPLKPEVMIRQVERLASDLRELVDPIDRQVRSLLTPLEWMSIKQVYLIGSGDSYHASCAAEMAFETIADVACEAMSTLQFIDYGAAWLHHAAPQQILVIATSASGNTPRVVQAIERAKEHRALTMAITGTPNSAVARVANRALTVALPQQERSPGIRTYQASLVGMLLLAIRLGEIHNRYPGQEADLQHQELIRLADVIDATNRTIKEPCRELAKMIANTSSLVFLGSGPGYGTARYSAAKMVEASGLFAVGQDIEEWWHVERFAYPIDMPVFVIAPPGRSHWRAIEIAAAAHKLGRRVISVAHKDDTEIARYAHTTLPVQGNVREEFSPLLYHLFASYLASYVTERLGRMLFQSDHSERSL